jgi:hypothetical protein
MLSGIKISFCEPDIAAKCPLSPNQRVLTRLVESAGISTKTVPAVARIITVFPSIGNFRSGDEVPGLHVADVSKFLDVPTPIIPELRKS